MSQFIELLEGTFSNKRQAQGHPTRYAHIIITHKRIGENRFYGEQAYNYMKGRPYRQFVLDVIEKDEKFFLRNFELKDATKYIGAKNLDQITDEDLTYRDGCDIMFERVDDTTFKGGTTTCECYVDWQGKKTYLENDILLTSDEYHVVDKGFDVETKQKVWGSNWGHLKFARMPL